MNSACTPLTAMAIASCSVLSFCDIFKGGVKCQRVLMENPYWVDFLSLSSIGCVSVENALCSSISAGYKIDFGQRLRISILRSKPPCPVGTLIKPGLSSGGLCEERLS